MSNVRIERGGVVAGAWNAPNAKSWRRRRVARTDGGGVDLFEPVPTSGEVRAWLAGFRAGQTRRELVKR